MNEYRYDTVVHMSNWCFSLVSIHILHLGKLCFTVFYIISNTYIIFYVFMYFFVVPEPTPEGKHHTNSETDGGSITYTNVGKC